MLFRVHLTNGEKFDTYKKPDEVYQQYQGQVKKIKVVRTDDSDQRNTAR